MKKTFLICVLIFALLCASCQTFDNETASYKASDEESSAAPEEMSVQKEKKQSISLVVLGDSIARGYGLESPEEERWSAVLCRLLKEDFVTVNKNNFGVDGLTGQGLADQLTDNFPTQLTDCDAVLVSIGGNNVLSFLGEITSELMQDGEYPVKLFEDFFRYAYAPDGEDVSAYAYAVTEMNELVDRVNGIFQSESFIQKVSTAGEKLNREIPEIVSLIREKNPDARIVFQTVYNPYQGMSLQFRYLEHAVELSDHGAMAVSALNRAIKQCADEQGYEIADVYGAFEQRIETLTNAGIDLQKKSLDLDPHPNKKGHEIIALIYYELLTEG